MMHLANEGALEMHQLSCQTAQLQVHKQHTDFDLNEYFLYILLCSGFPHEVSLAFDCWG